MLLNVFRFFKKLKEIFKSYIEKKNRYHRHQFDGKIFIKSPKNYESPGYILHSNGLILLKRKTYSPPLLKEYIN